MKNPSGNALLVVSLLALTGQVTAADPAPPDDQLLRGPVVPDHAVRTLVRIDAQGRMQELDALPEEAALALLPLDDERRNDARKVVEQFRTSLGMLLVDQVDLIRDSTDAIQTGDRARAESISAQLYERFNPGKSRDLLVEPLATVLTAAERAELTRLVDEYWTTRVDREMRSSRDRSDDARRAVQVRLAQAMFQREVQRAYEWTLRPYRQKLEAIYEATDPEPDQRAAIRELVLQFIRETRLAPTPEQRRDLARSIYQALDEERRIRLVEHALQRI